jgi:leucyl aminopeptidase
LTTSWRSPAGERQAENEPFWRLPLAEFHRSQLPSNFAELNNTAARRTGGRKHRGRLPVPLR